MTIRFLTLAGGLMAIFWGSPEAAFALEPALDARSYPGPSWSPYLVGAGIGMLSWLRV